MGGIFNRELYDLSVESRRLCLYNGKYNILKISPEREKRAVMFKDFKNKFNLIKIGGIHQSGADLFRHLIVSWLLAVLLGYLQLPAELRALDALEGLAQMSLWYTLLVTACGTGLLWLLGSAVPIQKAERWGMTGLFLILSWLSAAASFTWPYFTACVLLSVVLILFGIYGWDRAQVLDVSKIYLWLTVIASVIFLLTFSLCAVSKVRGFGTATYDFGLFAQMFHYMKTTGAPLTTLERDGLLSHFHVHMSPIYYLMLPFYILAPHPATLQVLQVAVITSAVIPLWKIGTAHKLPDWQKMLLCILLLLYPAFAGGISYDLHENCFLTPLLLWLFYAIDRKNTWLTAAMALLTLMVKEDAAVYVAVIGLWAGVRALLTDGKVKSREFLVGAGLLAGAVIWFGGVSFYLQKIGNGIMSSRYNNFMFDDSGSLLTVIQAVLMNPMKALYECVDPEKIKYIGLTLFSLLGLPLLTRRYERYLLLIPYLLVNLMSDYPYQHDVNFQYNFGSLACLFYMTVVNLADMKLCWKRIVLLAGSLLICAQGFTSQVLPSTVLYPEIYRDNREQHAQIRQVLDRIPQDATVSATTYYTTYLSQRDILYDVEYSTQAHILETEYVVLADHGDLTTYSPEGIKDRMQLLSMLEDNGYMPWDGVDDVLTIFRRS